jgi:cyanophycin synthetase
VLAELRVLDGPNVYFPRPAVKLTLDVPGLAGLDVDAARAVATAAGAPASRPGLPGTGQRQVLLQRVAEEVVRAVARTAGTTRLGVRARPGAHPAQVVVAYPWRRLGRAEALGQEVAAVLDELPTLTAPGSVQARVRAAAAHVASVDPGPPPDLPAPLVPVVSVTGTNGKTTVTRLIAHLAMADGRSTGWTSTDGVYLNGALDEPGDWSGPGGARRVLGSPGLQVAVLETARGGLLLRGMGVAHNDVSVVTNVSADHLGMQGVDTLDQLADVKSVVVRVTRADGWCVLNGDDPRTLAMRSRSRARPWVFSLDPASPSLRLALDGGGRGATVLDGDLVVLSPGEDPDHLVPVLDVPVTLSGLSPHNIANALAAAAAGLGLGLRRRAVVDGLRTFRPDLAHNPGRMNIYSWCGVTVVVDLAHNEAGLEALLLVMRGLCPPGSATRLVLGTAGDRQDEMLVGLGELAAKGSDDVVIAQKERYLRGRSTAEMAALFRTGAARVGVRDLAEEDDELTGLQALLGRAEAGDVVGVMCHAQRVEIDQWLRAEGATDDGPDDVRRKVTEAQAEGSG